MGLHLLHREKAILLKERDRDLKVRLSKNNKLFLTD